MKNFREIYLSLIAFGIELSQFDPHGNMKVTENRLGKITKNYEICVKKIMEKSDNMAMHQKVIEECLFKKIRHILSECEVVNDFYAKFYKELEGNLSISLRYGEDTKIVFPLSVLCSKARTIAREFSKTEKKTEDEFSDYEFYEDRMMYYMFACMSHLNVGKEYKAKIDSFLGELKETVEYNEETGEINMGSFGQLFSTTMGLFKNNPKIKEKMSEMKITPQKIGEGLSQINSVIKGEEMQNHINELFSTLDPENLASSTQNLFSTLIQKMNASNPENVLSTIDKAKSK